MRERIDYTEPPISFEDRRQNGVGDVDMQVGPEGHALVEREEVRSGHLRESWVELGTGNWGETLSGHLHGAPSMRSPGNSAPRC